VALHTFREAVRDRVLYNLVFFCAAAAWPAAVAVGQISIGHCSDGHREPGLSAISVIGLLISIFSRRRAGFQGDGQPARFTRCWPSRYGDGNSCSENSAGWLLTLAVNTAAMAAGLLLATALREALRWNEAQRRCWCGVFPFG